MTNRTLLFLSGNDGIGCAKKIENKHLVFGGKFESSFTSKLKIIDLINLKSTIKHTIKRILVFHVFHV